MVTKGIIKSIDLRGNTCTVHMPFFETAGNDPIIGTATISNTPGSYNGYKVGDVVWVAFEDGSMSTPVIIGKLYLGVEKEKADPRGVSNVEESTAAKKATLPADAKLAANIDSTVPNTTVPYSSLSSIANGLNTLNTNVGQMDRDYGNRFKQVITEIGSQGKNFESKLEQTSKSITATITSTKEELQENIDAVQDNVDQTNKDLADAEDTFSKTITETKTALEVEDGRIKASVEEVSKTVSAHGETITSHTTQISQNTKSITLEAQAREEAIKGVTADYQSKIEQTAKNINARVDTKVDSKNDGWAYDENGDPITKDENGDAIDRRGFGWDLTNDAWTIKAYDQTEDEGLPDEGLDIFKITRDSVIINAPHVTLAGYPRSTTIRYAYSDSTTAYPDLYKENITQSTKDEDINLVATGDDGWTTDQLEWQDGKYIWQWTQTAKYEYSEDNGTWEDTITDKVICLAGASAASYWLNCSTKLHAGDQQAELIEITAMMKVGTGTEQEDTSAIIEYRWAGDENFTSSNTYTKTFTTADIKNKNLEIRATHNGKEYARETIIFSPLNTPILDLSNDSATIAYDGGTKLGSDVSCKAELYLNGKTLTAEVIWFSEGCTSTTSATKDWSEISKASIKVPVGDTITISHLATNNAKATCWAFEKLYEPELIIYRATFDEDGWANYGALGHLESWTNAAPVPVGNYFVVIGKSTDENKNHVLWYQSQTSESTTTTAYGRCVAHKVFYEKDFTITKQLKGQIGDQGVSIISQTTYYALVNSVFGDSQPALDKPTPTDLCIKANNEALKNGEDLSNSLTRDWNLAPPAHTPATAEAGWKYWTTVKTEYSVGDPTFSDPIINEDVSGAYALAQGKTTNYYSATDPNNGTNIIKKGDCWFTTGVTPVDKSKLGAIEDYLGYKIKTNVKCVRDFVPVKRNSDSVYGLFDKIENKFYPSSGVTFAESGVGPTQSEIFKDHAGNTYTSVLYITSTENNQYIDTGINTRYEDLNKFTAWQISGQLMATSVSGEEWRGMGTIASGERFFMHYHYTDEQPSKPNYLIGIGGNEEEIELDDPFQYSQLTITSNGTYYINNTAYQIRESIAGTDLPSQNIYLFDTDGSGTGNNGLRYRLHGSKIYQTSDAEYSERLTKDNLCFYDITPGTTGAYDAPGLLLQWDGSNWADIGGELVANKVTANYINALDITAKKVEILDSNNKTLFKADGLSDQRTVEIAGFAVGEDRLFYAQKPDIKTDASVPYFYTTTIRTPSFAEGTHYAEFEKEETNVPAGYLKYSYTAAQAAGDSVVAPYIEAATKIIFNKDYDEFSLYLGSNSQGADSTTEDNYVDAYVFASTLNAPYLNSTSTDYYIKKSTKESNHSLTSEAEKTIGNYLQVTYENIKQNDYIYIACRKNTTDTSGDRYIVLLPKLDDLDLEVPLIDRAEGDTWLTPTGTAGRIAESFKTNWGLTLGPKFGVDLDGNFHATAGQIGGFDIAETSLQKRAGDAAVVIAPTGIQLGVDSAFIASADGKVFATDGTFTGAIEAKEATLTSVLNLEMATGSSAVFDTLSATGTITADKRVNSNKGYYFGPGEVCGLYLDGEPETIQEEVHFKINAHVKPLSTSYVYSVTISSCEGAGDGAARRPVAEDTKIWYTEAVWGSGTNAVTIDGGTAIIKAGCTSTVISKTRPNSSAFQQIAMTDTAVAVPFAANLPTSSRNPTNLTATPSISLVQQNPSGVTGTTSFKQTITSNDANLKLDCKSLTMNGTITATEDLVASGKFIAKNSSGTELFSVKEGTCTAKNFKTEGSVQFKLGDNYYTPAVRLTDTNSPNCFWSTSISLVKDGSYRPAGWYPISLPQDLQGGGKIIAAQAGFNFPNQVTVESTSKSGGTTSTRYDANPPSSASCFVHWDNTTLYVYNPLDLWDFDYPEIKASAKIGVIVFGKI